MSTTSRSSSGVGEIEATALEQHQVGSDIQKCIDCPKECQQPLTIFSKHRVKPDKQADFEEWIKEMNAIQQNFQGYLSSELIRPLLSCNDHEYVSIFRYDNYAHLQAWMDSSERQDMVEKTPDFSEAPLLVSYHSLEHWFVQNKDSSDGSSPQRKPPAKYKMWLVTMVAIFSQIQWIPLVIQRVAPGLHPVAEAALTVFILVTLVQYVIFPILTRLLAFWLFPDQNYWDVVIELVPSCFHKQSEKTGEKQSARKKEDKVEKELPV